MRVGGTSRLFPEVDSFKQRNFYHNWNVFLMATAARPVCLLVHRFQRVCFDGPNPREYAPNYCVPFGIGARHLSVTPILERDPLYVTHFHSHRGSRESTIRPSCYKIVGGDPIDYSLLSMDEPLGVTMRGCRNLNCQNANSDFGSILWDSVNRMEPAVKGNSRRGFPFIDHHDMHHLPIFLAPS